jgi:hypothetical protein
MKLFLPKLTSFSILELGLVKLAFAQGPLKNPINADDFGAVIEILAKAVATVGISVAAVFLIYSGFLFVSARGNEQQITKAKTTFFWTIIGTALIVGAWAIALALKEFTQGL